MHKVSKYYSHKRLIPDLHKLFFSICDLCLLSHQLQWDGTVCIFVHMMQFVCLCLTKGHCHHYSVEHHLPFGWLLEKSTDILRERFFQHWLHRFSRLAPHIHPEPEWVGSIRSLWPRSNTSNGSGEQAHLSMSLSSLRETATCLCASFSVRLRCNKSLNLLNIHTLSTCYLPQGRHLYSNYS